jgi:hypothetical protein
MGGSFAAEYAEYVFYNVLKAYFIIKNIKFGITKKYI